MILYGSQVWHPYLIKDIVKLESIQRRATEYILTSEYNSSLDFLPLMYEFELCDILFCIRCLRSPAEHFNVKNWITFSTNATRSGSQQCMCHSRSTTTLSLETPILIACHVCGTHCLTLTPLSPYLQFLLNFDKT